MAEIGATKNMLLMWIDSVIENDEGGWKFTNDLNDPGGATFGGMTYKTYVRWARGNLKEFPSLEGFCATAQADNSSELKAVLKWQIREAYYSTFCAPVKMEEPYWDRFNRECLISCAVNLGVGEFVKLVQITLNHETSLKQKLILDGIFGKATEKALVDTYSPMHDGSEHQRFLKEWRGKYCRLVQDNCEDWEAYIRMLEVGFGNDAYNDDLETTALKPKTKRWRYLAGWIARVDRHG